MTALAVLALVLGGTAAGLAVRAVMLPRAKAAAQLDDIGRYGFPTGAATPSPEAAESRSVVMSAAGRAGDVLMHWLGRDYETEIKRRLMEAGLYDLRPRTLIGVQAASSGLMAALLMLSGIGSTWLAQAGLGALGLVLGFGLPYGWLRFRARTRLETIDRKVPDLIDMLVVTIEGGLGFGASMQAASARTSGPLGDELKLTMQEQRMGLSMQEALVSLGARVTTRSLHSFVRAVTQGEALGVSIGTVMRDLAAEMRVRRRQEAEERAQKAPVKMLFPLIFLMFPALGIVILGPAVFEITNVLSGF